MSNRIFYISDPQELEYVADERPPRCNCSYCNFSRQWLSAVNANIFLGIFLPFLWFFNLFIVFYTKRFVNVVNNHSSHQSARSQMNDRAWYTVGAIIVYTIFASLIYYGIATQPKINPNWDNAGSTSPL